MKILYFDCFSGISGDMALAALLDICHSHNLGIDEKYLCQQLNTLNVDGWEIKVSKINKNGIEARNVDVILEDFDNDGHNAHSHGHEHGHHHNHDEHQHSHEHEYPHQHADVSIDEQHQHSNEHIHTHKNRTYKDIVEIIDKSGITPNAKNLSKKIFERLAIAEGKIHGQPVLEVHFHEVGAVDSIIDIIGVSILIDAFNVDKIYCSVVNDGHGFIHCQHGLIPVPVPAVVGIFSNCEKAKTRQIDIEKELVTPTGAAIVAELSEDFCLAPQMKVIAVGYGAGKRELTIPNVLRITLGEIAENNQEITILETNIDDCTGEILGYVMEKLFEKGALDVFYTSIMMKKSRPAVKLTVLCNPSVVADMESIIFNETTTIGIRKRSETRSTLTRSNKTINTQYGELKVKAVLHEGVERLTPEYDSARVLAEKNNVSLRSIYECLKEQS